METTPPNPTVLAVFITFPNETVATEVGEMLVERRLAACVNLVPGVVSLFRWDGEVTREREVLAFAKTTRERLDELVAAVRDAHPYELPCVVAYPAAGGLTSYLEWVADETRPL
jgi:periplasmic divalent cation tolerance protein